MPSTKPSTTSPLSPNRAGVPSSYGIAVRFSRSADSLIEKAIVVGQTAADLRKLLAGQSKAPE